MFVKGLFQSGRRFRRIKERRRESALPFGRQTKDCRLGDGPPRGFPCGAYDKLAYASTLEFSSVFDRRKGLRRDMGLNTRRVG